MVPPPQTLQHGMVPHGMVPVQGCLFLDVLIKDVSTARNLLHALQVADGTSKAMWIQTASGIRLEPS